MGNASLTVALLGMNTMHGPAMAAGMLGAGAAVAGLWVEGEPIPLAGFRARFPDVQEVGDPAELIGAPEVELVLICTIPDQRAALAIAAMRAGKDVMVDKPGCVTLAELDSIKQTVASTGRIWSVNFGEHFEQPTVLKAKALIDDGAIGRVVQTVGLGPHRLNRPLREPWFFDRSRHGGILADIGAHHIDQFMFFTGAPTAEIVSSSVANYAHPDEPELEDYAELLLHAEGVHGFVRLDWLGPDSLPHPGDGRIIILGTEGFIELRKQLDLAGRAGGHHLFLTNAICSEHIDCSAVPLTYFRELSEDVRSRTEAAMTQAHCFEVTRLALTAEASARRLGNLKRH